MAEGGHQLGGLDRRFGHGCESGRCWSLGGTEVLQGKEMRCGLYLGI